MRQEYVRYGLAFMTALYMDDDESKVMFSQLMQRKSRKTPSHVSSYCYENVLKLVLDVEPSVTFETVLLLVDMMLKNGISKHDSTISDLLALHEPPSHGIFNSSCDLPIVENDTVAPVLFDLLPFASEPIQQCILRSFLALISGAQSTVNRTRLSHLQPSVIEMVLLLFPQLSRAVQPTALELLQQMGKHSISVSQLKRIFRVMQVTDEQHREAHVAPLLDSLAGMIENSNRPKYFVSCQGEQSGLELPPLRTWPATKGYSFSVWFSIAAMRLQVWSSHIKSDDGLSTYEPVLLSLRQRAKSEADKDLYSLPGIEISLHSTTGSRCKYSVRFTVFPSRATAEIPISPCEFDMVDSDSDTDTGRWHHLAFSHIHSGFRTKSEIVVLINGRESRHLLSFPRFNDHVECTLGDRVAAYKKLDVTSRTTFCGDLGMMYFFSETLLVQNLQRIFELGPSYGQVFNDKDGSLQKRSLHISPMVMLAINPGVSKRNSFLDNTPESNTVRWASLVVDSRSSPRFSGTFAKSLPGTFKCMSRDMRDALDCLGGIKALLPIFAQVDLPVLTSSGQVHCTVDDKLCLKVVNLVFTLLRDTAQNHNLMDGPGFTLVAYFLERISPDHFDMEFITCLIEHTDRLSHYIAWQDSVLNHILGDFKIWVKTSFEVQMTLFTFLISFATSHPFRAIQFLPVQRLLDCLLVKYSYSSHPFKGSQTVSVGGGSTEVTASVLTQPVAHDLPLENLTKIRSSLVEMIFVQVSGHLTSPVGDLPEEEIVLKISSAYQCIVSYICEEADLRAKVEGLQLLIRVVSVSSDLSRARLLASIGSRRLMMTLVSLVSNTNMKIRLYALALICSILQLTVAHLPREVEGGRMATPALSKAFSGTVMTPTIRAKESTRATQLPPAAASMASVPIHKSWTNDHMEQIGLSTDSLTSTMIWIQDKLAHHMKIDSISSKVVDKQSEIIFSMLQLTMHGMPCKHRMRDIDMLTTTIPAGDGGPPPTSSNTQGSAHFSSGKDESDMSPEFEMADNSAFAARRICIPMVWPAILSFLCHDAFSVTLRGKIALSLKTSLASWENCESVLKIPCWQKSLFDCLSFECERRENFISNNKRPIVNSAAKSRYHLELEDSRVFCDLIIKIVVILHMHALNFNAPMDPSTLLSSESSDEGVLQARAQLLSRRLGATLVQETISYLRCYSSPRGSIHGVVYLDVQDTGTLILQQILTELKRDSDVMARTGLNAQSLSQSTSQSSSQSVQGKEFPNARKKILRDNLWGMTAVVLEFISIPPLQQAKSTRPSSGSGKSPGGDDSARPAAARSRTSPQIAVRDHIDGHSLKAFSMLTELEMEDDAFVLNESFVGTSGREDVVVLENHPKPLRAYNSGVGWPSNTAVVADVSAVSGREAGAKSATRKRGKLGLSGTGPFSSGAGQDIGIDSALCLPDGSVSFPGVGDSFLYSGEGVRYPPGDLASAPNATVSFPSRHAFSSNRSSNVSVATIASFCRADSLSSLESASASMTEGQDQSSSKITVQASESQAVASVSVLGSAGTVPMVSSLVEMIFQLLGPFEHYTSVVYTGSTLALVPVTPTPQSPPYATAVEFASTEGMSVMSMPFMGPQKYLTSLSPVKSEGSMDLLSTDDVDDDDDDDIKEMLASTKSATTVTSGPAAVTPGQRSIGGMFSGMKSPVGSSLGLASMHASSTIPVLGSPPSSSQYIDGVFWILLRVTFDFFVQVPLVLQQQERGEVGTGQQVVVDPLLNVHMTALDKVLILLEFTESKAKEFYEMESIYMIAVLSTSIRQSRLPVTSKWTQSAAELLIKLFLTHRQAIARMFYEPLQLASANSTNRDSLLSPQERPSSSGSMSRSRASSDANRLMELPSGHQAALLLKMQEIITTKQSVESDVMGLLNKACELHSLNPGNGFALVVVQLCVENDKEKWKSFAPISRTTSYLSWTVWDCVMENVLRKGRREENSLLATRLTEIGMHKDSQEMQLRLQGQESAAIVSKTELSSSVDDAVGRTRVSEQKRLRESQRVDECNRKRVALSWNGVLAELANERGPWGCGVDNVDVSIRV